MAEITNPGAIVDFDGLMRANLSQVFGERDAAKRLVAIERLYAHDAVLNEPHASAKGHAQINDAVSALLNQLPPDFYFVAAHRALGHHDIGVLRWSSAPQSGPATVTGIDVAHIQNGQIQSLHVFLNPSKQAD